MKKTMLQIDGKIVLRLTSGKFKFWHDIAKKYVIVDSIKTVKMIIV